MTDFLPPMKGTTQEEGTEFRPKFGDDGLITAVATDATSGEVLMLAHMNAEALTKTLQTGNAHYRSRSRGVIWLKGSTSGNVQMVQEVRVDCDQDAILLKVSVTGSDASCHTGRVSCFYRTIHQDADSGYSLSTETRERIFDPKEVYEK